MSYLIWIVIGVLFIITGFIIVGHKGHRKTSGIISITVGFIACIGAIYPTYLAASMLESKHRTETQYLIDHAHNKEQAQAAIAEATKALQYAKSSNNATVIEKNKLLLNKAKAEEIKFARRIDSQK